LKQWQRRILSNRKKVPRAIILILDSFGIGGAKDADQYGDAGADTLGHIAESCALGHADRNGVRRGPLKLPHLAALGLGLAAEASTGQLPRGWSRPASLLGQWGYGVEQSKGKDTPSGHWEIAGTPVLFHWGHFPPTYPSFPEELIAALVRETQISGILGNRHASGTAIIDELGEDHLQSAAPICYTSADSVLQIAAHEEAFGLERLYSVCRVARRLCDSLHIGRVIARPFIGETKGHFVRTQNRKDFAMPPPSGTLLDRASEDGREVISIGKIGDIFAHRNTGEELKGASNMAHFDLSLSALDRLRDGGLLLANFVDFDSDFGHRRDVAGYGACLEAFDARISDLFQILRQTDLLLFTADHGNDPTWTGTDHTREHVPILACGGGYPAGCIGRRQSLADIGETIAKHLGLPALPHGQAWI
jgi:phosphopentomutase